MTHSALTKVPTGVDPAAACPAIGNDRQAQQRNATKILLTAIKYLFFSSFVKAVTVEEMLLKRVQARSPTPQIIRFGSPTYRVWSQPRQEPRPYMSGGSYV